MGETREERLKGALREARGEVNLRGKNFGLLARIDALLSEPEADAEIVQAPWSGIEGAVDLIVDEYEWVGEDENGREVCYAPTDRERLMLKDFAMCLVSELPLRQRLPQQWRMIESDDAHRCADDLQDAIAQEGSARFAFTAGGPGGTFMYSGDGSQEESDG